MDFLAHWGLTLGVFLPVVGAAPLASESSVPSASSRLRYETELTGATFLYNKSICSRERPFVSGMQKYAKTIQQKHVVPQM